MKPDAEKLSLLLEAVSQRFGRTPRTPTDFVSLADHIHQITKRTLGVSTLKRLFGYIKDQTGTTYSTLSLLSRYVGYNDWDGFCTFCCASDTEESDSDFTAGHLISTADMAVGTRISLAWNNEKSCIIRKIANPSQFVIEESTNIKLRAGDKCEINCLALKRPLYASNCTRGDTSLGAYAGAHKNGISVIRILDQN